MLYLLILMQVRSWQPLDANNQARLLGYAEALMKDMD